MLFLVSVSFVMQMAQKYKISKDQNRDLNYVKHKLDSIQPVVPARAQSRSSQGRFGSSNGGQCAGRSFDNSNIGRFTSLIISYDNEKASIPIN